MKRFRIGEGDIVKAYASSTGCVKNRLLASVYDSGFTRLSEVIYTLNRKIPHYSGAKICYNISIPEKEISKCIIKKVN